MVEKKLGWLKKAGRLSQSVVVWVCRRQQRLYKVTVLLKGSPQQYLANIEHYKHYNDAHGTAMPQKHSITW
mgnify:CR=1 FL=1